jgi:hypothetical protein
MKLWEGKDTYMKILECSILTYPGKKNVLCRSNIFVECRLVTQ